MNDTTAIPFAAEARACRVAQAAWSRLPVAERLRPVRRLRRLFVDEADGLCDAVTRDVNRPAGEVLITDVLPTADAFRFLERSAKSILRPKAVSVFSRPLWLWGERDAIHRRPHGVVGIIGTWNYPIYLNAIQIVQALTAGNGVLWKPSELTPVTAERLHSILLRAGYAADLVQRLPATREAGPQLAEADVDHVIFTGSAGVGRKLAARLGERLISSTLELSGCDAMFVLADADIQMAAKAAWFGLTLNKGQTCLAIRRMFVDRTVYQPFLDALRVLAIDAPPMRLVLESQVRQADQLIENALTDGARLLNDRHDRSRDAMRPTIVIDAKPEMTLCREASFAPIAAVIPFSDLEQAVAMCRQCEYGLGAAIFSASGLKAARLAARIPAGMVAINDALAPAAHPATPFGGRGASGWGVTQGAEGLLAMTVPQVVSIRSERFRPHYESLDRRPELGETMRGMLEWSHGSWRRCWRGLRRMAANGWKLLK
jgi:acyl-CoA reductase-like NAD-dependent aldehyde dehydrogenase